MGIIDWFTGKLADSLADRLVGEYGKPTVQARAYRKGVQRRMLRVRPNQFDDNITINFIGLAVNRIVSQMVGNGIKFDFEGDTETEQEQYVKKVLELNKFDILSHRLVTAASESGTGYLLIQPDGVADDDGKTYPRLILQDPAFVTMDTLPEDFEMVIRYNIQYRFTDATGKDVYRKRVVEQEDGVWYIRDFIMSSVYGGIPVLENEIKWLYSFCPMLHWQNLPSIDSPYGEPDFRADMIALQDKINFLASNIAKVIRLFAHPARYGKNITKIESITLGPDDMPILNGADQDIKQLDSVGDLPGAQGFLKFLRQAFFDNSRLVDIDSMQDKMGTLTNFGLKVLYQDNTNMIATKRALFGEALETLIKDIQIMAQMQVIPAKVIWPDFVPSNEVEETSAVKEKIAIGVMSKQTGADELGLDWVQEQERIDAEKHGDDDIGTRIINAFNRTGGNVPNNNAPKGNVPNQNIPNGNVTNG